MAFLNYLEGEDARPFDRIAALGVGLLAAIVITVENLRVVGNVGVWQQILIFVLAIDLFGGIISNMTASTSRYYVAQPIWFTIGFLVLHVVHPIVAVLVSEQGNWLYALNLWSYTFVAAMIVRVQPSVATQRTLAAAFIGIGFVLVNYELNTLISPSIRWLGFAYLVKLILGFAVDYSAQDET